ncbi:MAG: hypothetical protein ACLP07_06490 [Terracidiphilus sp.]
MQHRAPSITHAGNLGTRKVNLPVHRHQQLYRFDLSIMRAQRAAGVRELVAQVLDGVTQNFQGAARLGRDAPAMCTALVYKRNGDRSGKRETTQR